MIGETVGSYRITQALERRRWGETFLAEPIAGGALGILELVDADACTDRARVDDCLSDVRTAAALGQPGIARLAEAGVHGDGRVFLARERVDGDGLKARLARVGRLSVTQIADIGRQLAAALAAAHAKGIVHGDLAPDDIELVPAPDLPSGERVVLRGFGLSRLPGHRAPAYVPPECWTDGAPRDARSDTYALGCILFQLACGQLPFDAGVSLEQLRAKHLSAPPPLARSVTPDVPSGLEHLLDKMLQKRPEDRPRSLADLVRTFEVLGGGALATGPLAATAMSEALPSPAGVMSDLPSIQVSPSMPHKVIPAPLPEAPRYSEPPRKKGLPAYVILLVGLLLLGGLAAFVLTRK